MAPLAAGDVCANYGIQDIEATVFDSSGTQVAYESWDCLKHSGQIDKVPAGSGISVVVNGLVTSELAWSGQAGNLVVRPGEITQAGTVTMKYIGNDTEPPEVLSTAPSHGAEAVPLDSLITVVFSEEMVLTIMVATNFSCVEAISQSPVSGQVIYNQETRTITFTPDAPFSPLTQYTATVSKEVEDLAGHTMPADYTWTFYTTFRDSDGDGMPDTWEEAYGLNPFVKDADQDPDEDGLNNLEEYNRGTLPNNRDTDGDGYNDGREIAQSTDPKDKDSHKGIPDIEVAALQAIYNSTSGSKWYYNFNWMGSVGTECSWYGVICDEKENHVTELDLNANRLSGTIPSEIGDLGYLTILLLGNSGDVGGYRYNQLTGDIPAEIGNLVNLTELDFSYNQLSGEIPTEVGELINLTILDLRVNRLSGPIPVAIGNLEKLTQIVLSSNMLSGPIPDEFLNLKQLGTVEDQYSDLSWNALYTKNKDLQNFLDGLSEGWETTQTVAPEGLTIGSYDNSSVTLNWNPIAYQADSGGYEVEYSTSPSGSFTFYQATEDKSVDSLTVQKLQPVTLYYFRVRTVTNVHDNNQNTVYSEYSKIISQETEPEPNR
jgi:hypothetical protein